MNHASTLKHGKHQAQLLHNTVRAGGGEGVRGHPRSVLPPARESRASVKDGLRGLLIRWNRLEVEWISGSSVNLSDVDGQPIVVIHGAWLRVRVHDQWFYPKCIAPLNLPDLMMVDTSYAAQPLHRLEDNTRLHTETSMQQQAVRRRYIIVLRVFGTNCSRMEG